MYGTTGGLAPVDGKLVSFLASRNSSAQYPASAHVVGLCSLTQTRMSSEALERKCSMAIFSMTSDFDEQSSNHRFARSTRLVASSVYDSPFPRDHSRNFHWRVSSLMSYRFIIACFMAEYIIASFVSGEGHIGFLGPPRQLVIDVWIPTKRLLAEDPTTATKCEGLCPLLT